MLFRQRKHQISVLADLFFLQIHRALAKMNMPQIGQIITQIIFGKILRVWPQHKQRFLKILSGNQNFFFAEVSPLEIHAYFLLVIQF